VSGEGDLQPRIFHTGAQSELLPQGEAILVCGTEEFCAEARREWHRKSTGIPIVLADGLESAQRLMARETPRAILAETRVLADGAPAIRQRHQAVAAAVGLLAGYAPVVWIGSEEERAALSQLGQPAEADFVPRSALCLTAAITIVERRLRVAAARLPAAETRRAGISVGELISEGRDFGEVLRHELNNPLTGILGNAELLLLEVRRGRLALPATALQRMEVIAELAVRMRETVRQLSDRWEAAGGKLAAEKPESTEEPQWPVNG